MSKRNLYSSWLCTFLVLSLMSCVTSDTKSTTEKADFILLTKEAAASVVTTDKKEGFFEKVVPLEMSIQLGQSLEEAPREQTLATYKKKLQEDLVDFTEIERKVVTKIMQQAMKMSRNVKADINLPTLKIIKTTGSYYGAGVFYTRDDAIIIPAPMIPQDSNQDNSGFLSTMLHEIFHIYSRYNTDKRDAMYARLGFERLPNLALSPFLQKRVLYNPDGVDLRYAITVEKDGRAFKAVPVIYSQFKKFNPRQNAFFSYLMFQLFEVKNMDGTWTIINENIGYSIDEIDKFWQQVTENTQYNIHPDELCADNFVLMAKSKQKNSTVLEELSPAGKKLVKDLEAIILE